MLTHFGISGPVVFEYSAYTSFETMEDNKPLIVKRIPDKEKNYDYWIKIIQEAKEIFPKKHVEKVLK